MISEEFINFINTHDGQDGSRLLLSASRFPGIDIKKAARIIDARKKIRTKIPSWYSHLSLDYPSSLSIEQCSSEATALYKGRFVPDGAVLADLTGGLGVDCFFMSRHSSSAFYIERNLELCQAAYDNFNDLGADNISVNCRDSLEWLDEAVAQGMHFDMVYLDPARRSKTSQRVYSITDCEPDITAIQDKLFRLTDRILVKVSPMADISQTLVQLPSVKEFHILESGGEVKELLLLMEPLQGHRDTVIVAAGDGFDFTMDMDEERSSAATFADGIGCWLYQPCKAVLKAGAFKSVSARFGVDKLAPSTHLYTSDFLVPEFPGKTFRVEETLDWNDASIKDLRRRYAQMEVTALNFPLDTNSLRKRLSIPDGGASHLFVTTVSGKKKVAIVCRNV